MYIIEFPFSKIVRLHSTVYYRIKQSTTNPFLGAAGFLKVFLKILDNAQEKLCYVVPFSKLQVSKLQPATLPCMFLKFWKIPEITCAVEFLLQVLYRIAALKSFLEKSQEGLRARIKRTPPWMFLRKVCKVCRNVWSSYFFKIEWTDASESSNSLFLEHQWTPLDG